MLLDPEKKKYFAIKADKDIPTTGSGTAAPYSRSHVLREKRAAKRRKADDRHRARHVRQRVQVAAALRDPLVGVAGLRREISDRPYAFSNAQRGAALVHGLRLHETRLAFAGTTTMASIQAVDLQTVAGYTVLGMRYHQADNGIYAFPSEIDRQAKTASFPSTRPLYVCPGGITAMSCTLDASTSCPYVVACGPAGHILFGAIYDSANPDSCSAAAATTLLLRERDVSIWDCQFAPAAAATSLRFAVAGTGHVWLHDPVEHAAAAAKLTLPLRPQAEAHALAWLDARTLAVAIAPFHRDRRRDPQGQPHEIRLWDVRTRDSRTRIVRQEHITGLEVVPGPDGGGSGGGGGGAGPATQLVVASNRAIAVFDLRNLSTTKPLLEFAHESQERRLGLAMYGGAGGLLAAPDRQNDLRCYSLLAGRHVRTLETKSNLFLRGVRWGEDGRRAPYLQACAGDVVMSWMW